MSLWTDGLTKEQINFTFFSGLLPITQFLPKIHPSFLSQSIVHLTNAKSFSPAEGNGNPLPYSCLRNRRRLVGYSSWGRKSQTWLSNYTTAAVFQTFPMYFCFMSFPSLNLFEPLNLCWLSSWLSGWLSGGYLITPLSILYPLQKLSMLSNRDSGSSLKISDFIFRTWHKIWEDVAEGNMSAS